MQTIVNGNHFCLGLVDFEKSTFSFLDPLGTSKKKTAFYFRKLAKFIDAHNTFFKTNYDCTSLKTKCYEHILQRDGYNCGPLIVYFFDKLSKNESLNISCDMKQYRQQLQYLLINKASNMSEQCLLCARKCLSIEANRCDFCKRYVHIKCNSNAMKVCFVTQSFGL